MAAEGAMAPSAATTTRPIVIARSRRLMPPTCSAPTVPQQARGVVDPGDRHRVVAEGAFRLFLNLKTTSLPILPGAVIWISSFCPARNLRCFLLRLLSRFTVPPLEVLTI